jgi:CubicO group peptidase (beta-lactamase class C family)
MTNGFEGASGQVSFSSRRLSAIGLRLEDDVAAGAIAGAAIAIGTSQKLVFECNIGFRDVSTRDPLQPDAIWRIYSMTKPLVTAAAMTFVENGQLRLDQHVADFIPSFAQLRVAQPDGTEVNAKQTPTIQDLMRHTAGLSYGYLGDSPAQRAYSADGFLEADLSNAAFVARLAALPLEHHPGTVWHYSHATDVLAHLNIGGLVEYDAKVWNPAIHRYPRS